MDYQNPSPGFGMDDDDPVLAESACFIKGATSGLCLLLQLTFLVAMECKLGADRQSVSISHFALIRRSFIRGGVQYNNSIRRVHKSTSSSRKSLLSRLRGVAGHETGAERSTPSLFLQMANRLQHNAADDGRS